MAPVFPAKQVYLAGPITGLTYGEARLGWRVVFADLLPPHIWPYSPMRVVNKMQAEQGLKGRPYLEGVDGMLVNREILERDEADLRASDAIVVNLLGAETVSQGTVSEMGMARVLRKPIVLVMEKTGNIHEHPFNTAIAGWRTDNLEHAAQIVTHLLTPGV